MIKIHVAKIVVRPVLFEAVCFLCKHGLCFCTNTTFVASECGPHLLELLGLGLTHRWLQDLHL